MRNATVLSCMLVGALIAGFLNAQSYNKHLTSINPAFMMTPEEGHEWNLFKAQQGPTYAGSPGWANYINFVERKLAEYGAVIPNNLKHEWQYNRYEVDDWPMYRSWQSKLLIPDISTGVAVPVASYGMCSGFTPPEGIVAPLIFYDPAAPPQGAQLKGKIVVFKTAPQPPPPYTESFMGSYTATDYEYLNGPGPFLTRYTYVSPSLNNSFNGRWVWQQVGQFRTIALDNEKTGNKFAGMVIVYDLPWDSAIGLTQRTTEYDCPTLTLDRMNGAKVIQDAKAGKTARMSLDARYVPSTTRNFVAFLAGKNYGTDKDEVIGIGCHTDAMSLTQDNGCLGVLGIFKYFSNFPQAERPRTLMAKVDSRHFMPGGEGALGEHDAMSRHPELWDHMVATMGMEHMGELEGIEIGEQLLTTGQPEYSYIGIATDNDILVDIAIKAVKDNNWRRADIKCPSRPGIHGGFQQGVRDTQNFGKSRLPSIGLAGNWPGYHTQIFAGIERFDKQLFYEQVAALSQIAGEFMVADLTPIDLVWGNLKTAIRNLPDRAFKQPTQALNQRAELFKTFEDLFKPFKQAEADSRGKAIPKLQNMKKQASDWIIEASQSSLIAKIDDCVALCSGAGRHKKF
jgi:hypothetical protein